MTGVLTVYVVYDHPRDYPQHWVVGKQFAERNGNVTHYPFAVLCDSLEEAREQIPFGLTPLARFRADDPVIHEVWL